MKRRQMKKNIPADSRYCGDCKNKVFARNLNDAIVDGLGNHHPVVRPIYVCLFMKTDTEKDDLLWEGIKVCEAKMPKEEWY